MLLQAGCSTQAGGPRPKNQHVHLKPQPTTTQQAAESHAWVKAWQYKNSCVLQLRPACVLAATAEPQQLPPPQQVTAQPITRHAAPRDHNWRLCKPQATLLALSLNAGR